MRKKPKLDLGLSAYEELFMNENERIEASLPKIYDIPIKLIDDFPAHPFKVKMDDDMEQLVASIKEQGLITPVILRPKEKGRYEMVSGHRRKEACLRAGLTEIKAEVREISHDEAIILMVDSNLQRTEILPSEKAFSYKMRLEALKRQGKRSDATCGPVVHKSRDGISEESGRQVSRYIRLTELIPELLDLVDARKMAMRPAIELSYLTPEEQKVVYEETALRDCMPSHAQAIRMRKLSAQSTLTDSAIDDIMKEEKPNQKEKIHIPYSEIRMFLPKGMTVDKTNDYIKRALEFYQKNHVKGHK
ncbi:MAG: ParB/RepB/Spo0J family partition protein [Aeriscardovia sp.]|nr:ParB/RepB/Spo0J family partition protein [Aeriscardovia sp.]